MSVKTNRLEVAEEEVDSEVEGAEGADDDEVVNPGMISDHRSRGRIRPTKDPIDAPSEREVVRLHTKFTKLAIDIFSKAPKLTDRSEGVLNGFYGYAR